MSKVRGIAYTNKYSISIIQILINHNVCFVVFLVTIESVGALPPDVLFIEAIKVLKQKCRTFLQELNL